jgi:hypothetical protein
MLKYEPRQFRNVWTRASSKRMWKYLNIHESLVRMDTAVEIKRTPYEGVAIPFEAEFARFLKNQRIKQMVGHMIRQIMTHHGYRYAGNKKLRKPVRGLFTTGCKFVKPQDLRIGS